MDCPDTCSLLVSQTANGDIRLRGNPQHPFTKGFTCRKIKSLGRRLHSPDRLQAPLLKTKSGWQAIDWEQALDRCASEIQKRRQQPASILHVNGSGAKGLLKTATKMLFNRLGATKTWGSLCDAAGFMACIHDCGSRRNPHLEQLLEASTIVNWGKQLPGSSIHLAAIVRRAAKKGTRVVTIATDTHTAAALSDMQIMINPGSDRFLAALIIKRLLAKGMAIEPQASLIKNLSTFKRLLAQYDQNQLLHYCGIPEAALDELETIYAADGAVATLIGTGLQRYRYGGLNVRLINALARLTGHFGLRGGGCYYHLHSMRHFDLSILDPEPVRPRRTLRLPLLAREIEHASDPPIGMLWVNGTNIVNQAPASRQLGQALAKIPFKVVVDAFMTDTSKRADLILPCTLMLEQEDIIASFMHDFIHYVAPAVKPPPGVRDDYAILADVGRRLTPPIDLPDPHTCLQNVLASVPEAIPFGDLQRQGFFEVNSEVTPYLNGRCDHEDGQYRLPTALGESTRAPLDYPLQLLTLIREDRIHSQILPADHPQRPCVAVAPENPALQTLDLTQPVWLVSAPGRLRVDVAVRHGLHPQTVVYHRGDWMSLGGGANQLIEARTTDIGCGAAYYDQFVRLENE
jgi:anaerobic selenocysteine-containing dehydrogenase